MRRWVVILFLTGGCAEAPDAGVVTGALADPEGCAPEEIIRLALPAEKTPSAVVPYLGNMTRDHLLHAVSAFALPEGVAVSSEAVELQCGAVFPAAVAPLRELATLDEPLAVFQGMKAILGTGLHNDARNHARQARPLPATAEELMSGLDVGAWPTVVISESRVKGLTRVLHCGDGISIARTRDAADVVRETEVIVAREDGSGRQDFYVYGAAGALVMESEFMSGAGHAVTARAPVVCASCHYDPESRRFQNRPLTWGAIPYPERLVLPGCGG